MKTVFRFAERLAGPLLRLSLGLVLLWIGAIHLATPQPVVRLLSLPLPFLAARASVSVLGALEVLAGLLLIVGLWVRYVALLSLVLFAGTLTIFVIAPAMTGFPGLSLMGQFLLKDVVLASTAIMVLARDAASHKAKRAQRTQLARRSGDHALSPVNTERGYCYLTVLVERGGEPYNTVLFYNYAGSNARYRYSRFLEAIKEICPLHRSRIRDDLIIFEREKPCVCGWKMKKIALGIILTGLLLVTMALFGYVFKQAPTLILALWPLYWAKYVDVQKGL